MAKLPTREDLGPPPSARSGRPIASADQSAIGNGVIAFGRGVSQLGAGLEQAASHVNDADQFETERRFQDFKWHQQQELDKQMREVEPGGTDGFADNWEQAYKQNATEFFKTIPEPLKPKYDLRLFENQKQLYGAADTFAKQQQKDYSLRDLTDEQNQYFKRAEAGEPLDTVKHDFRTVLDANPYLSPIEKDTLFRKGQGELEKLNIRGRIARGDDIENILSDLNALPPEIGKTKGLVQPGTFDLQPGEAPPKSYTLQYGKGYVVIPATGPDGKELSAPDAAAQFESTQQHLGMFDTKEDAEAYLKAARAPAQAKSPGERSMALISAQLETGKTDALKGVANISKDSNGSKSYGNFGLNSGGSLQQFMSQYGASLDIAGAPGTPEFDRNWKAFAAAEPEQLHAAEMQWYQETILPRISGDLTGIGVPEAIAGDPRVKAYIADRMIQYGPESVSAYGDRISRAADAANGDPVAFMAQLSKFDKANVASDFRSFLGTVPQSAAARSHAVQGLNNRISARERLSMSSQTDDGAASAGSAMYPHLSVRDRSELLNVTRTAYREQTMQDLRDSMEEIRRTGKAPVDDKGRTALDRMKYSLTANQQTKERLRWEEANAEYKAISPLQNLTPTQARDHLDQLHPDVNADTEHYAIAARVHDKAAKEWEKLQDLRDADPATAVDTTPEVTEAKQALAINGGRATAAQQNERLIEARKAAQERLQIPQFRQRIITKREAKDLLMLPSNPESTDEVETAMKAASERAKETYGRYAPDALASAIKLYLRGSNDERQTAIDAADAFRALQNTPPAAPQQSWQEWLFGKSYPTPNQAQIDWVLQDAKNRQPVFDQTFGAGSFAKIQAARTQQQPKKAK